MKNNHLNYLLIRKTRQIVLGLDTAIGKCLLLIFERFLTVEDALIHERLKTVEKSSIQRMIFSFLSCHDVQKNLFAMRSEMIN